MSLGWLLKLPKDVSFLPQLQHHACLPAAIVPTMKVTDSDPLETMNPNQSPPGLLVLYHRNRKITNTEVGTVD
jgi:hypothetical protein